MTNAKSTKRALLTSMMAMLLCFTMLLGTTYAWFTDSVTSANNIITSGNLDIELEYWNGTEWKDVKDASDILTGDRWEPGYVDVAYLKVTNAGSLALKYQLGINIVSEKEGTNIAGDTFKLSDYIYMGVVEGVNGETAPYTKDDTGRAAAIDAAAEKGAGIISTGYTKTGNMLAGADDLYLAVVVYMPTTVDNVANHNGENIPEINLGINLIATQYTKETDSFGPDYDENAPFSMWDGTIPTEMPETLVVDTEKYLISINDAAAFAYLNTLVNSTDFYDNYGSKWKYSIELNADIDLANKEWTPITLSNFVAFEGNGHTIKNLSVTGEADDAGLFARITCNDIGLTYVRNFTIDGASVSGKRVGAVAGDAIQGAFSNVNVNNATVTGTKYVGGLAGKCSVSTTNCSVKNSTVTGSDKTVGGLVGYSVGDPNPIAVTGNTVENVTVIGAYNVGGLLGAAQNETVENNTVKNVNVISTTALPADASSSEVRTGEVVARNVGATVGTNTVINVTTTPDASDAVVKTISTADELVALGGTNVNGTYVLMADLDMTGKEMKSMVLSSGANVNFIGNGHTISNLNLEAAKINGMTGASEVAGLFDLSAPTNNAVSLTVSNLTIKNATVACTGYAAAIVGYTSNGNSVITLNNVDVDGANVEAATVAALVGYTVGEVNLTDCDVSKLTLTGEKTEKMGAYVGTANTATCVVTTSNCTNDTTYNNYGRVINSATAN